MAEFKLDGLHVRYHAATDDEPGFAVVNEESTFFGMITLRGFAPLGHHDAFIDGCYFEEDESLPAGTMVIEPWGNDG